MRKIERDINERFIRAADDIIERKKNGVVDKGTFCKAIKIHPPVYAQIKSNIINLSIDKAFRLGKTFGVSMNWLFFEIGPMYMRKDDWKEDIRKTIKKLQESLK